VTARTDLGRRGEELAVRFLESRGWRVVARNFRRTEGEVDIVASRGGVLSFVEVKTRRTPTYGLPGEAVTARKRARIRRLAVRFLAELGEHAPVIRFDVVEISASSQGLRVRHIEEAF
jgi:putative endonuclease